VIQCKRVYELASPADGYRVLVDRLWPRGLKKTDLQYDEWNKTLAPSTALRKAFHADLIDFTTFRAEYMQELDGLREEGCRLVARGNVTLLYATRNTTQNHAEVLAEWLRSLA
jgi:uncharacterized protein YeaO (DUF488 family)